MAKHAQTIEVLPSPRRLVEALRDVGYDFTGAVADLVDNSIAANATTVDIDVQWDGPDTWLRIADDGVGMDSATITEALRFGSERSYRPDDLGKFGLGLKTASLSQCRQIYVASRMSEQIARMEARRFDLDWIIEQDKWEVEVLAGPQRPDELTGPLKEHPGTVVVWHAIDRLFGSRTPNGTRAETALWGAVERLEQHLGMVFHRFLEGDLVGSRRSRRLTIRLNGNIVRPWNPFATEEKATERLKIREIDISSNGVGGVVTYEPFVLPAQAAFSSMAAFNRMSGPNNWNQQQGFYIYRANRMIQSGGWSRMRAPDEHSKLARVALDFFPELDSAFGINIAKMRVNLPPQLRERLKDPVEELVRQAKRAYSSKSGGSATATPVVQAAPRPVLPAAKPVAAAAPSRPPMPDLPAPQGQSETQTMSWPPPSLRARRIGDAIRDAAAQIGEAAALTRMATKLRELNIEVADELGW